MVDWLAGKRVKGTSSERTASGFAFTPAVSGGWVELDRTTLGSAGSTITVSNLPNKRYYMVLSNLIAGTGSPETEFRLNGDTGTNYLWRWSNNGGADGVPAAQNYMVNGTTGFSGNHLAVSYFANYSSKEKLQFGHGINNGSTGAGTNANRNEFCGKWVNTSNAISQMQQVNLGGGGSSYASGSELVVLGWDPDDTHTTNFWEELASVEADGTSTDMSSGTITAKKYLWIQLYQKGRTGDCLLRFNSDSGSNYTRRFSQNGGAEDLATSSTAISNMIGIGTTPSFGNAFIINIANKEKLVLGHHISQSTAGATSAPSRMEFGCKWVNTSAQITNVNIISQTGNFPSGSILKVWGAN